MKFADWLENRRDLAKGYKNILHGVPQEPSHHPEGDALAHTRLVRKAIPRAIEELKSLQRSHPQLSNVLSNLNFDVSPKEMEVLKISAWLHDIGKASATTVGGLPFLTPVPMTGKIQSIGHQDPEHYMPQIEKLKDIAPPETIELFKQNEPLIRFLVDHHMDFVNDKFSRNVVDEFFRDGKIVDDPRIKLLLILMWSDKMGRKPEEIVLKGIAKNADKLAKSAEFGLKRQRRLENQPKSFGGTPDIFVQDLRSRGVDDSVIAKQLPNKYPQLTPQDIQKLLGESVTFRTFMEMQEAPTIIQAEIPVSDNVKFLLQYFKQHAKREAEMYVVGGAVRDFLRGKQPKDIDLTTNLSEEEAMEFLDTPDARRNGIRVNEKGEGEGENKTFGVIFANVNGEALEIAPFRQDIGIDDGRRPGAIKTGEEVKIWQDAERRDLTMNNLYYDIEKQEIHDYNDNGEGIQDAKNGIARPVGDPFTRFKEDQLRVLRLVRFFSRYNNGDIMQSLDQRTLQAIDHYKELKGITPERKLQELLSSVKTSVNTSDFFKNLVSLDLLNTMFPGMQVDIQGIDRIGNSKNLNVILAWLLRGNDNVPQKLNGLKYPAYTSHAVGFLQLLLDRFQGEPEDVPDIAHLIKSRDKFAKSKYAPAQMQQDVAELSRIVGADLNQDRAQHFANYPVPNIPVDDDFRARHNVLDGDPKDIGPKIGAALDRERIDHYRQSFQDYLRQRSATKPSTDGISP